MLLNGIRARLEAAVAAREDDLRRLVYEAAARLRDRRHDPGAPRAPRPAAPAHADPPRDRGHLPRHGLRGVGRRRGRERRGRTSTRSRQPQNHPSRSPFETFYLDDDTVLRTHTSPDQIRAMQSRTPPIYLVSPGRVYRRDTPDATHSPTFLQVECLAVDRGITLADLRGTVLQFFRALFGPEREVRMRTSHFPFTEPSVEFDVDLLHLRRRGLRDLQALGLDRDGRRRLGRPGRLPQRRPRPRRVAGVRVRLRHRAHRDAPPRPARPARVLGERPARAGAV